MKNMVLSAQAIMEPDVYKEPYKARWNTHFEGDKDNELSDACLILDPAQWPAGTIIQIHMPTCPVCHDTQENCESIDCTFDWNEWIIDCFS